MKTGINGVSVIQLNKNEDSRGFLIEIYRTDIWSLIKARFKLKMAYISETKPSVARGPHEHVRQTDYFVFIGPGSFDLYLWDNRPKSKTFGKHLVLHNLGENNPTAVIVPPGVVHGYQCVSQIDGWCINLLDELYKGYRKKGKVDEIRHENNPNSPFQIVPVNTN